MFKKQNEQSKIVYFDIRIDSPYEDTILIAETPLENEPVRLSGRVIMSVVRPIAVSRISLRLVGKFKLEFVQVGKYKDIGGVASVVKEQKEIFECRWDNMICDSRGQIIDETMENQGEKKKRKIKKKNDGLLSIRRGMRVKDPRMLELPIVDSMSGTPYEGLKQNGADITYQIAPGNYELPFEVDLPHNIPETVEGLQSGSILYSLQSQIKERINNNEYVDRNMYKYLRIFRTLSVDNLSLQEEMHVGHTWKNKLQYEVKIPSRAVAIGSVVKLQIRIFPFLSKLEIKYLKVGILQYYAMKDNNGEIYDDTMMIEEDDSYMEPPHVLYDIFDKIYDIPMPNSLRAVTQDCDVVGDRIQVRHQLSIQFAIGHGADEQDKTIEVRAKLPLLLYVSPHQPIRGRYVLLDQNRSGEIHFRPNKFVPLFGDAVSNTISTTAINTTTPPEYQTTTTTTTTTTTATMFAAAAAAAANDSCPPYDQVVAHGPLAAAPCPAYSGDRPNAEPRV